MNLKTIKTADVMRVNQLDAKELDKELISLLSYQIQKNV